MLRSSDGGRYKDPESGTDWANEHTFRVAKWMLNDLNVYSSMRSFAKSYKGPMIYRKWIADMGLNEQEIPGGWKLISNGLNYAELNEIMEASRT